MKNSRPSGGASVTRKPTGCRALDTAKVDYTSEIYLGTVHGFTMADTDAFDPAGLQRHWDRLPPPRPHAGQQLRLCSETKSEVHGCNQQTARPRGALGGHPATAVHRPRTAASVMLAQSFSGLPQKAILT